MRVIVISAELDNWIKVFRTINTLLDYGVSILLSRDELKIEETIFAPGAFIIPSDDLFKEKYDECNMQKIAPLSDDDIIEYIKSEKIPFVKGDIKKVVNISPLKPSKVAFYEDSGCFSHAMVIASCGFNVGWLNGREIAADYLDYYDILLSGGGGGAVKANINRENLLLAGYGVEGAKKVAEFVKNGGAYFGCCGGSYVGSKVRERFMNWWHPAKKYMTMMNVEDWHIDEYSDSGFKSPGQGVYTARNVAPDNPVMFGLPETFKSIHWNGPIWNIIEAAVEKASSAKPLIKIEEISADEFTPSEFFQRKEKVDSETIKETGMYRAKIQKKTPIAQGYYGMGLVVLSGSHPEMAPYAGTEIEHDKLWPSARILSNAALWAAAQSPRKRKQKLNSNVPARLIYPLIPQKEILESQIDSCKKAYDVLKKINLKPIPFWLKPELYSTAFNLTPKEMYLEHLERLPILCEKVKTQFEAMDQLVEKILMIRDEISEGLIKIKDNDNKREILNSLKERAADLIFTYYSMLGSRKPPQWYQEGKERFQGIYDLIQIAESNAKEAIEMANTLDIPDEVNLSPKAILNNPYTKLNAISGRLGSALKLLWVNESAMVKYIKIYELYQNINK